MYAEAPRQNKNLQHTASHITGKATTNPLQRKEATDEDEALQMKRDTLQRQAALEEEEPLQMKQNPLQRKITGQNPLQLKQSRQNPLQPVSYSNPFQLKENTQNPLQPITYNNPFQRKEVGEQTAIQPKKENNTGLPDNLKAGVEALSGYSMDDVKVHYNSDKPAQLQALAYAQGTDIHVAPGQEKHLPHEAWHVVQQKQGRVQPTMQMKQGIAVNDDIGLENEADVMASCTAQPNDTVLFKKSFDSANFQTKNHKIIRKPSKNNIAQLYPKATDNISDKGNFPLGFESMDAFQAFIISINDNLNVDDATVVIQGSSITGVSFKDKGVGSREFDNGRVSDFDVAIVSNKLYSRASTQGIKVRGDHTEPLTDANLVSMQIVNAHDRALEHATYRNNRGQLIQREVNFMIYGDLGKASQHSGPSLVANVFESEEGKEIYTTLFGNVDFDQDHHREKEKKRTNK